MSSLLSWIDYNPSVKKPPNKQKTMQAVRYHGANVPLKCQEIPKPSAPKNNEVLIQVKAAALCHTELHFAEGTLNLGVKPMTLGHEAVGVIVAVGSGVPTSRMGERVIVYYYVGCATCRWCRMGQEQVCANLQAEYGFLSDGGLAEYITCPARNAVHLPESVTFEHAAPIGCGLTTAVHASKMARLQQGETVLVYGCNGVGFGLVQLVKTVYKASKVMVVSRTEAKRQKAVELGADVAIDGTDASTVAAAVREATDGEGVDVIFECVGRKETMNEACVGWAGALGRRGRMVLIGYHAGDEHDFRCHPMPLIVYEQSIIGSVGATLEDLKEAVEYVEKGQLTTVVDSTIKLKDFQSGLDKIKSCSCVGKIVCIP
jgi:propanol-preferring alcohol dehydrogenase